MKRVLNFGAGTQSSVLALLAEEGQIEPFDAICFSDLGWEPKAVYKTLAWMQGRIKHAPITIIRSGDIRADALRSQVRGKAANGDRWASMPLYVKKVWHPEEAELFRQIYLDKPMDVEDEWTLFGFRPNPDVKNLRRHADLLRGLCVTMFGMIRRQCTSEYKIQPIRKWIKRNLLNLEPGQWWPREPVIQQVFGISYDERQRVKIPNDDERWAVFEYPLVELGWTRERVIKEGARLAPGIVFPRSACIGCPFHSNAEWRIIREVPEEWADAVEFDRAIRHCGGMRGEMFIHRDCVPLDEADLDDDRAWDGVGDQECFGMCGV